MNLIPQFTARDAMGREFLEVEGVRLGNEPVTLFHTRIGKRHGRAAARPYPHFSSAAFVRERRKQ